VLVNSFASPLIYFPQCHGPDAEGEDCGTVRWQKGSTKSPSHSPPHATQRIPILQLPAGAAATSTQEGCPTPSCGQKRIAPDCKRRLCRKHCIAEGSGCLSKNHIRSDVHASNQQPQGLPPSTFTPTLPTPTRPIPMHTPVASSPTALPALASLDANPNPRYASHMPAIFTEQVRREQELAEAKRRTDAEQIACESKAKRSVVVYSWAEDGEPPNIHQFQGGFTWPYFIINEDVLSTLELSAAGSANRPSSPHVQLYQQPLGTWVGIHWDYVVQLSEGASVFLKARKVRNCIDLDKHIQRVTESDTPHLRYNLPGERRYIRERLDAGSAKGKGKVREAAPGPTTSGGRRRRLPPVTIVARESGSTRGPTHSTVASPDALELSSDDEATSVQPETPLKRKRVSTPFSHSPPPFAQSSKRLRQEVIELSSDSDEHPANSPSLRSPVKVECPCPSLPTKRQSTSRSTSEWSHAFDSDSSHGNSTPSKTTRRRWPAHYHAIDVVAFFDDVDNHPKETTEHIFAQHFPDTEFRRTTYYDNRSRWTTAKPSIKTRVLDGRRSLKGLWSHFLKLSKK
jgi:hypothetical protein